MRAPPFLSAVLFATSFFCSQNTCFAEEAKNTKDTKSTIEISSKLRWGADSESGAPYSFFDPKDPSITTGFEYDIITAIADVIGKEALHVQNAWEGLIPGLNRRDYDVVINGLEITEDRKEKIQFSEPYYITHEQLVVRKNNSEIQSLSDCRGKKIGTLKFTVANRILEVLGGVDVITYEAETNSFEDLQNERIDAVLIDSPAAVYYAKPNPKLKLVGGPVGKISYGIGIRNGDATLLSEVNRGLKTIQANGRLREILERWNLWNPLMAESLNDKSTSAIQPVEYLKFLEHSGRSTSLEIRLARYSSFFPLLMQGALNTIKISILSMILAIFAGITLALGRLYGPMWLRLICVTYVEVIRGTPLLIQLFFIFYGLPNIGVKLSPFIAAILGLGFNYAAYEAENYRAGIQSVPRGQMEAALALGMSKRQAIYHVIIPQAMRLVIPPVTNDFIALLKDSSLVSVITMVELTKVYGQIASTYFDYFGTGILVAILYFVIGLPFVRLSRYFERKLAVEKQRQRRGRITSSSDTTEPSVETTIS